MQESDTAINSNNSNLSVNHDRSELTPLYSSNSDTGTLKLIIIFFTFFTVTLTFGLIVQIYYGHPQVIRYGSVSSDSEHCSNVGVSMINEGGNAVDAAIATAFCISVINPHITGLGGGGIMLIYSQRERKPIDSIDFRVTRSTDAEIGVPGFVAGLELAHKLYGMLPWKKLLEPAISISSSEFPVPLAVLAARSHLIQNATHNEELVNWYSHISSHSSISMPELAETLTSISIHGSTDFYKRILKHELAELIDPNDIINYEAVRGPISHGVFNNYNIIVPGDGSGGPILLRTLNNTASTAQILSLMDEFQGMSNEWPFESGSSIVAFDVDDLYVSLVSGLGSVLGSQLLMESGYILNNFLQLTKDNDIRPLVLMTPLIAIRKRHVCAERFAVGAADVRDLSQVVLRLLNDNSNGRNLTDLIEAGRVRILDKQVAFEANHYNHISQEDEELLRRSEIDLIEAPIPYPSINVIEKVKDDVYAHADSRGFGCAVTY